MGCLRSARTIGGRVRAWLRETIIETTPNLILNRVPGLHPVPFEDLRKLPGVEVNVLEVEPARYMKFLAQAYPEWRSFFAHRFYKKLLEFYATYTLLDIKESDTYLDAAGGCYTYVNTIQAARRVLHDCFVNEPLRNRLEANGVEIIECLAERIPLPDSSVDKISCHHSFEHFRGDADILFVRELQRLLKHQGKACIVPLFIGARYYEITDSLWVRKSDPLAKRAYDPTSPFPGGRFSGRLARVYDNSAFIRRVLAAIKLDTYKLSIYELRVNGRSLPDPTLKCHRTNPGIDFPYRAMVLERSAQTERTARADREVAG